MKEYKYLAYILQAHVREKVKKNSSDGEGMEHKKKKIWKGIGKKNVDV